MGLFPGKVSEIAGPRQKISRFYQPLRLRRSYSQISTQNSGHFSTLMPFASSLRAHVSNSSLGSPFIGCFESGV